VEIRYYATQGEKEMPAQFKAYAQRVEDLLAEYKQHAKGNIEIKKFNPARIRMQRIRRNSTGWRAKCFPTASTCILAWR
jgi:ABC-type uncharacterized transport system involved in gliding motility auxiliary subunit